MKICCIRIYLLLLSIGIITGCGEDLPENINLAPIISVFEAESEIVPPGGKVIIHLEAVDLENDILTYEWSAEDGELDADKSGATWVAPETEQKYQIQVTVSDGEKTTTSTIDIQVWKIRPGDYYPLSVGNIWRYRDDADAQIIFEIVDTIQIQLAGGKTVESFVLQKSSSGEGLENIVNYTYLGYDIDENGEVLAILQHAQNTTSGTEDTVMFTPFIPLYQFPLITGEKWEVNFEAGLVPQLFPLGEGVDSFEVLSEETVTVPAGTYDNVFKVEETFQWGFDIGGNQVFPFDLTVVQKWLAPDVGLIKFTQSQTRGEIEVESVFELESYDLK